jgi:hypothetical protein
MPKASLKTQNPRHFRQGLYENKDTTNAKLKMGVIY